MKDFITLNCFENFKCTNKNCSDNCCIGWEIDVDDETLKFYKSLEGDFAKKLEKNIKIGSPGHFIMDKEGRCPFLNKNNLCDIILELGEDKIPYICKNHPRFYTWLEGRTEMGIGIACEEGARLLLTEENLYIKGEITSLNELEEALTLARETAIFIIKNKNIHYFERLLIFNEFAKEIDELLFFEDIKGIKEKAKLYKGVNSYIKYEGESGIESLKREDFLKIYKELEPINKDWEEYLDKLICDLQKLNKKDGEFNQFLKVNAKRYENLFIYFVFRYFLKSLDDGELIPKANFIIASVLFILLADFTDYIKNGSLQKVANAVMYSKEVEYSDENINYLYEKLSEF